MQVKLYCQVKNLEAFKFRRDPEAKNGQLGAPVSQKCKELGRNGLNFWNQRGRFSLNWLYERKRGKKSSKWCISAILNSEWRTFRVLFSMGLRCYEPTFSLVLIFSTFLLLSACTNRLRYQSFCYNCLFYSNF